MARAELDLAHFVAVRQALAAAAAWRRVEAIDPRQKRTAITEELDELNTCDEDERPERPPVGYHLTYEASDGALSRRVVSVLRIDPSGAILRLSCWCHEANGFRQFRADRIREVFDITTGEIYSDPVAYFLGHPMLTTPSDPEAYAITVCRHELNVLVAVAGADGRFDEEEQEKILIHVYDRCPHLDLDETVLRRRLAKLMPDARAFDIALSRMGQWRDGDPIALARSLRKVVEADGRLAPEELAFVEEVNRRLAGALIAARRDSL